MKTIVLTGGGTAGHIIPNIALLPTLKQHFDNIVYIGSGADIEKNLLSNYSYVKYYAIPTTKLRRSLNLTNITIPFRLHKGVSKSKELLQQIKPDVIFSKGGYVALPVVLAGAKLNVPMLAHESDYTLGLANKLVKNKFSVICTTFEPTAEKLKNGVYVGPIIRDDITKGNALNFKKQFGLTSKKPVLLVLGGSQGAEQINKLIWDNLNTLTKTHQVVHLCGKGKQNKNIQNPDYYQLEFYNKMQDIYACVDLCITRGGSNTIFELLANHIPMMIIPLQKGSRGDQVQNAKYFESHNYALSVLDKKIDNHIFITAWNTLKARAKLIRASTKNFDTSCAIQRIYKEMNKIMNIDNNTTQKHQTLVQSKTL